MIYLHTFKVRVIQSIVTVFHTTGMTSSSQINVLVLIKSKLYKDQTADNTSKVIYLHTFKDSAFNFEFIAYTYDSICNNFTCHPVLNCMWLYL